MQCAWACSVHGCRWAAAARTATSVFGAAARTATSVFGAAAHTTTPVFGAAAHITASVFGAAAQQPAVLCMHTAHRVDEGVVRQLQLGCPRGRPRIHELPAVPPCRRHRGDIPVALHVVQLAVCGGLPDAPPTLQERLCTMGCCSGSWVGVQVHAPNAACPRKA